MKVGFSPLSRDDLMIIADYIALDNPRRAFSYVGEIEARCQRIMDAPRSGILRNDIAEGLRSIPFGAYLIFYRLLAEEIRIERILHGARNLNAVFGGEDS
ncbi:MAG TPA: type II toxin-antitoxin system RelE/ParE family toxin [Asticcacaulis sp.]|nr:type II toxin-antitoxin system RelE/ParE family toxin [Asticcacaulis sp.]